MKNLLKISVFALYALCMMLDVSCVPQDVRPPILITYKTATRSVNANPTKANETFTKTYAVKLDSLFEAAARGIDINSLAGVFVADFTVSFNGDNCRKLESYSVEVDIPDIGKNTNTDCTKATDFTSLDTNFGKEILGKDFLPAIKAGKSITVNFSMKAKEDLPAGEGVTISMEIKALFKPQ